MTKKNKQEKKKMIK